MFPELHSTAALYVRSRPPRSDSDSVRAELSSARLLRRRLTLLLQYRGRFTAHGTQYDVSQRRLTLADLHLRVRFHR